MDRHTIRIIRVLHRLTQKEFATQVGLSEPFIAQIEGGTRRITKNVENRIRAAFQLDDETLIGLAELKERVNKTT